MTDLEYVNNMRVGTPKIAEGDVNWYVVNAANHVVKGPFTVRNDAVEALNDIRIRALEEAREDEGSAIGEHLAEARAVEQHQEEKRALRARPFDVDEIADMRREEEPPQDRLHVDDLDEQRHYFSWLERGLPWTGEFEDAVNRGNVDVS